MLKWNTHFRLLIPEVLLNKYQLRICCILDIISPSRNTYSLFLTSRYHLPFTPSCHSVRGGGVFLWVQMGCVSLGLGVYIPWTPIPLDNSHYSQQVGGTRPTGMLSCLYTIFVSPVSYAHV